jgi:DNA ligase-1
MTQFKPLLAASTKEADLANLHFPLMWSPKLDGIRTMMLDGTPVSRKLKPLPNEKLRTWLTRFDLAGLDGEMLYGPITDKDVFNRTQSAVMSMDGPCPTEAAGKYLVFDDFTNPEVPFLDRFTQLTERVSHLPEEARQVIQLVPHKMVGTLDDLMNVERVIVERGFEGVMGRSPQGRYKFGRSTLREGILFKIKRFTDAEARICGVEELFHNDNEKLRDELGNAKRSSHQENLRPADTMGALVCQSPDFEKVFKIGTGFTAVQRAELWAMHQAGELINRTATYLYQPSGMKDVPRFPSFKGLRDD